jgi:signal transduction histidine kinase
VLGSKAEPSRSAGREASVFAAGAAGVSRRTRLLFAGALLVAFGMVALAPWMIWDARRLAWDGAVQLSENVTTTLAHDIERSIESYDLALQAAILGLELSDAQGLSSEARHQFLFGRLAGDSRLSSMLALDENGRVIAESRNLTPRPDSFADRDFFTFYRDGGQGLFVSTPYRDRHTGDWVVALARPREDRGGRFTGVVAGKLHLDDFRALFERVDLGPKASITLLNTNRTIVIRKPYSENDVGRLLTNGPLFRHQQGATAGSFEDVSAVDGEWRLFTFRQIGSTPLVLALGQSSDVILAEWRAKAIATGIVVLGLVGVAALLGGMLRAELRRRSRVEGALGASNATMAAILRELPDGLQVFDRDGSLVAWNEQLFQILDLGEAERAAILAAPNPGRAFRLNLARRGDYGPGDPEELVAGREEVARAGRPTHFRRQSFSGRWVDVRGVPTADGGWLAAYRDVTEEVAREYELRDASERLEEQAAALCATAEDLAGARVVAEQASQSKSAFLANMSHELRTPLNGVIGFADIMAQEAFGPLGNPRYVEYIRDIAESGRHLLALINDILDFSKADAGKLELQEDEVDLVAATGAALRMVRSRADAAGLTLELRNELPPDVLGVRGDERRLKQIVLNLVSNAIKFTPANGRVSVTLAEAVERDGITVAVADTGIGIAAKDLPRVMEAFSQVDHGLNRRQNGTGLGLPLCKHLVGMHGGELAVDSTPGTGTTVTVRLPEARVLRLAEAAQLIAD